MKTYKDLEALKKRVTKTTDWADYFCVEGRMYQIYEYGPFQGSPCYVYFVNKRTHDAIKIEYVLPTVNYVNGEKVTKGEYRFIDMEFIPNMVLWRPII